MYHRETESKHINKSEKLSLKASNALEEMKQWNEHFRSVHEDSSENEMFT